MTGKTLVYTAICGDYDRLKPQAAQSIDCDWVCFTDAPTAPVGDWQISHIHGGSALSSRTKSRYLKIQNHELFPGGWSDLGGEFGHVHYEHTVWIDGSMQIMDSTFIEEVLASIGSSGWSIFRHPVRNCVYEEAACAGNMIKYQGQPMRQQAAAYRRIGYPAHNGLYACGVIARSSRAHQLASINALWWRESLKWSELDQISIPVVLWRLGLQVDIIPARLWHKLGLDVAHRMWEYELQTGLQEQIDPGREGRYE